MARNRSSKFDAAEGLDFSDRAVAQEVQEVQQVQEAAQSRKSVPASSSENKTIGSTQGKAGMHLRRINMAFSDVNHDYITRESRMQGLSMTQFVNQIIDNAREGS